MARISGKLSGELSATWPIAEEREALIRTSDRALFKRCRRKWGWQSHLGQNLETRLIPEPFWLGTGMHYALEDFHGYNVYGSPVKAVQAYFTAWKKTSRLVLPDNDKELLELLIGMMGHYEHWLKRRDPLRTYWFNGVPQVEVKFKIPLPFDCSRIPGCRYTKVSYTGKLDRVMIDDFDRLWIVEYKSAKQFAYESFPTDQQVSSYTWATNCLYPEPVAGVIYQQHKKSLPHPPELLSSGRYSANKQQATTWDMYYAALENMYGDVNKAPSANIECLNHLSAQESEDHDSWIRRDRISRNEFQSHAEGDKILMELEDMLNPRLPLYTNATKDCGWDCDFNTACVGLDSGEDYQHLIDESTKTRVDDSDTWRRNLPRLGEDNGEYDPSRDV